MRRQGQIRGAGPASATPRKRHIGHQRNLRGGETIAPLGGSNGAKRGVCNKPGAASDKVNRAALAGQSRAGYRDRKWLQCAVETGEVAAAELAIDARAQVSAVSCKDDPAILDAHLRRRCAGRRTLGDFPDQRLERAKAYAAAQGGFSWGRTMRRLCVDAEGPAVPQSRRRRIRRRAARRQRSGSPGSPRRRLALKPVRDREWMSRSEATPCA